jgi:hypothetical protein
MIPQMRGDPRRRQADVEACPMHGAAVKSPVSPRTLGFGAALLLDASPILFELIGLPRVRWLLPMYTAQSQYLGFTVDSANSVAAIKLDRAGLHMTLPANSPWPSGVFTWRDERWADMWKFDSAQYEGGEAIAVWHLVSVSYVPRKRGRGERGANRSSEATAKRKAHDAFMAHVLVKNLQTGAGVFSAAIDQVATEHPTLTAIVWPSRYTYDTGDPHNIRKHMQREIKKAG